MQFCDRGFCPDKLCEGVGVVCQWGGWHVSGEVGGTFHEGWHIPAEGLTLVLTQLMTSRGVAFMGGRGKLKVSLLAKPLELLYYFAPLFKGSEVYNSPGVLTERW